MSTPILCFICTMFGVLLSSAYFSIWKRSNSKIETGEDKKNEDKTNEDKREREREEENDGKAAAAALRASANKEKNLAKEAKAKKRRDELVLQGMVFATVMADSDSDDKENILIQQCPLNHAWKRAHGSNAFVTVWTCTKCPKKKSEFHRKVGSSK